MHMIYTVDSLRGKTVHTLEPSGTFPVGMTQATWLDYQSSIWLHGMYTGKKDKKKKETISRIN